MRHRQLGIERLNLVSDSGNETHGVGGIRSYRKKRIPGVRLGQWLVDRGLYRIRQPRVFHVSYDTDNLSLSRDALSEWVLIWKELPGRCFADDGNLRRVGGVGGREKASPSQRNAERAEEIRADKDHVRDRWRLIGNRWAPFNREIVRVFVAVGGKAIAHSDDTHAWQRLNSLQ